ncbi:hypothetical protein HGRIS_008941 [Hohenbuehelia grisea]|uniref:Uncharacterized protein n=1 Tax=Hohenbuehelia grisea TaxID=104357 RepID=A0ABR3IZS7_9AGAR
MTSGAHDLANFNVAAEDFLPRVQWVQTLTPAGTRMMTLMPTTPADIFGPLQTMQARGARCTIKGVLGADGRHMGPAGDGEGRQAMFQFCLLRPLSGAEEFDIGVSHLRSLLGDLLNELQFTTVIWQSLEGLMHTSGVSYITDGMGVPDNWTLRSHVVNAPRHLYTVPWMPTPPIFWRKDGSRVPAGELQNLPAGTEMQVTFEVVKWKKRGRASEWKMRLVCREVECL